MESAQSNFSGCAYLSQHLYPSLQSKLPPKETPIFEQGNVQVHSGSVLTLLFMLLYAAKQEKGLELHFGGIFAVLTGVWCLCHFTALVSARAWPEPGGRACRDGASLPFSASSSVAHQSLEMGENLCLRLGTCIIFL